MLLADSEERIYHRRALCCFMATCEEVEFDTMANKILSHLHKGANLEKIKNIIASDLVAIYGFYNHEIDATAFAQGIIDW